MAEENDIIFEEESTDRYYMDVIDNQLITISTLYDLSLPNLDVEIPNIMANAAKIILKAQKALLKTL